MILEIKETLKIIAFKIHLWLNENEVFLRRNGRKIHKTKFPLLKIIKGKGIDVGCGCDKISPGAIGVDIIGKGEVGKYGGQKNRLSVADIKAKGDNLFMFKDNYLDYVISRDNLEHYVDFLKTLKEWNRVLKIGGKLGITMPDDKVINSIKLDPTHKHAFTIESLTTALNLTGFKVIESGETIRGWGFYIICEKI